MVQRDIRKRIAERLGSYLRALRHQKGWTQALAGEAIGVDAVTIRRWELGLFSPSTNRIEQVADAYGVEVSELMHAAEAGERDETAADFPVKGYVGPGSTIESATSEMGSISLPLRMVEARPDDHCLRVSGDSLAPDGIHDGDVLLVRPDLAPTMGSLCVIAIDNSFRAVTYITQQIYRVRTVTGSTVDVEVVPEQRIGTVSWHVRKM